MPQSGHSPYRVPVIGKAAMAGTPFLVDTNDTLKSAMYTRMYPEKAFL